MSSYRYKVRQYHSIGEADIAIDGITVLAGENGAGKSTLARWLYYIVNVSSVYERNRFEEFQQSVAEQMKRYTNVQKDIAENGDCDIESLGKIRRTLIDIKYHGIVAVDTIIDIYERATSQFCNELMQNLPLISENVKNRILNISR